MSDDRKLLAAELALGLLDPEEQYRAERALRDDAELAGELALWEDRLASLLDDVPEATPTRDMLGDVQRSLFGEIEAPRRTARRFPWGKLVLGVVAVKAALVSGFFYTRSAATETYRVETQYGQSVLNWNARTGNVQLSGGGSGNLHLWLRSGSGYSYVGPGGTNIAAGLAVGAIVVVSDNGEETYPPYTLQTITLARD